MATPITVNYTRDGDDWKLIVSRDEKSLAGHAPGLIAARDRADQLVEKLAPKEDKKVVVHLLDGDAFAFTTEYLAARLAKPAPAATPAETAATPAKSANAGSKPAANAASPAAPGGAAAKTASGRSTPADAKEAAPAGAKPTDTKAGARKKSAPGSHRAPQEDKPAAAAAAEKSDEPKAAKSADGPEATDTKKPSDDPSEKSADENAAGSVAARLSGTATDRVAN